MKLPDIIMDDIFEFIEKDSDKHTMKNGEIRLQYFDENAKYMLFFDVIKDLGSTKAMFFGHDHINNFEADYQGVKFCYGIKSTDRIYHDDDMMGCQTITIHDDHSLKIDRYYHTYAEVK